MEIEEVLNFIRFENERLLSSFHKGDTKKEFALARVVKINEEVGELCDQVLGYFGHQRKEKNISGTKVGHEIADVILTTLLLADFLNIDIKKELKEKMEKVKLRKY